MSISKRLEELVSNPHLKANKRDYNFAVSLQEAYQRQGRLTPGRRPWLDRLEEKYSEEAVAARAPSLNTELITRIQNLIASIEDERSWGQGFAESVLGQVQSGATLSPRQLEIIAKLEKENSYSVQVERQEFAAKYKDESTGLRAKALVVANYYLTTPYFRDICRMVVADENYVPSLSQYNKIVENKYAKKILAGHFAEPKFPAGSLAQLRATAPQRAFKKVMVIKTNYTSPTSACAGNKVYQVLPIGETTPIVVEERHIKTWRAAKK
tara:strand:- start:15990 stop:16793 length:804 start_codon:yes stop_codon:yes gene_type:complete